MSDVAIFIVGSIIFAITVYGSVMGGGIALGRLADSEDDATAERPDPMPAISSRPNQSPVGTESSDLA